MKTLFNNGLRSRGLRCTHSRDDDLEALECREEIALSEIAEIRDTKNAKRKKHQDAWKIMLIEKQNPN